MTPDDEADDIRNFVAHAWERDDDGMTADEFDALIAKGEPVDLLVSLSRGLGQVKRGEVSRRDDLLEEEDVD